MKSVWFRAAAVGVAALLLTAAYKRAEPSSVMADAANAFLNSLWPDQKAKVSYAFDDDERTRARNAFVVCITNLREVLSAENAKRMRKGLQWRRASAKLERYERARSSVGAPLWRLHD